VRRGREDMEKSAFGIIYDVVKQIPYGKVATYGQIAELAGNRRWARVVGYALHANPDPATIPCYRVVNQQGEVSKAFAFGGENQQIKLLEAEGVEFIDGRVDMQHYAWQKRSFI
jgi:methylated-DNA-protein-cysteine methyltransferase-like protein